jgi:hypothetical protein
VNKYEQECSATTWVTSECQTVALAEAAGRVEAYWYWSAFPTPNPPHRPSTGQPLSVRPLGAAALKQDTADQLNKLLVAA